MFSSWFKPYAVVLLASIVTVTNAGAAPSLVTSTPITFCEVICCDKAPRPRLSKFEKVAIIGSG